MEKCPNCNTELSFDSLSECMAQLDVSYMDSSVEYIASCCGVTLQATAAGGVFFLAYPKTGRKIEIGRH